MSNETLNYRSWQDVTVATVKLMQIWTSVELTGHIPVSLCKFADLYPVKGRCINSHRSNVSDVKVTH